MAEIDNTALAYQKCFDTEDGKIVLERLSVLCHEDRATYCDMNPNGSAYNEGKRCVMLHIRSMLKRNINEVKQKESNNG